MKKSYIWIIKGNIYQPDLIRNNYVQGIPYDYSMNSMNPALLVYNDPVYIFFKYRF